MNEILQPTYDDMLPSDLITLEAVDSHHTLALWYWRLNRDEWPEELAPCESPFRGSPQEWRAKVPDRRDDLMEWIKNKVSSKYLLMVWQCELMLANVTPEIKRSEAEFETWWNEPYPGDRSCTKGENNLRSAEWWARTREEWRAERKIARR